MREFRKQFILTKKNLKNNINWKKTKISKFSLYSDVELEVNTFSNIGMELFLIGDAFDYQNPCDSNEEILKSVISDNVSLIEIIKRFDEFSGTYIVLYNNKLTNQLIAFNDATAQREIYYYLENNTDLVLGSQTNIISSIFDCELDQSKKATDFYSSTSFKKKKSYVGDLTEYKDIKHLKPNHYLDLNSSEIKRFYPYRSLSKSNADFVAKKSADMIKGYLESASNRYRLLLPVSAGWESRILLAASKDIQNKCHYFVFQSVDLSDKHIDIKIPKILLKKLNLKLHIVKKGTDLNPKYIPILDKSIAFPRYENFNYIIGYFSNFPNHMSVTGNVSEIARMEWPDIYGLNGKKISMLQKYPLSEYAVEYYDKWLNINSKNFKKNNFRILDMLYWEENCGNWVAKTNTESKMAIECFLPFNSRKLIDQMLTVNRRYRGKQNAKLYLKIINNLWSDCLQMPINPSNKKIIISIMQKSGIYAFYRNLLLLWKLFAIRYKNILKQIVK